VALGIIFLSPGSGKEVEASVSGFGQFGERMAFLSRGVDQGGLAFAVEARQSEQFAQTGFRVRFDEDNGAR
jgi:hypothetical protein